NRDKTIRKKSSRAIRMDLEKEGNFICAVCGSKRPEQNSDCQPSPWELDYSYKAIQTDREKIQAVIGKIDCG
ncbi:MAG: hypothetical protein Q4B26_20500, partial [Eubacteriales bacterium]|nr:hypothetical protein [Eubacteriales bacterium]